MSYGSKNKVKTEHGGAKNGGGYWGKREEAKTASRKLRRSRDKKEVSDSIDDLKLPKFKFSSV